MLVTNDLGMLRQADLVLTVTSAVEAIVRPEHLKSGAIVCDVARPRDVSKAVVEQRDDVFVFEGGLVEIPGPQASFNFDFGFPPKTCYACMAETIALALEGRYENYTLGKDLTVAQVKEVTGFAQRHGFKLAGFRSFEQAVPEAEIERIRVKAGRTRPVSAALKDFHLSRGDV